MVRKSLLWVTWAAFLAGGEPLAFGQCNLGAVGTTPVVVSCTSNTFAATGAAGTWNAYGLYSTANWDLGAGGALSLNQPHGFGALLANGHAGTVPSLTGTVFRAVGSANAILGRAPVQTLANFGIGSSYAVTMAAAVPMALYQFALDPGFNLGIRVGASDPSLRFAIFSGGGGPQWVSHNSNAGNFQVGATATVNLPSGQHAIAVFRGPLSTGPAINLTIDVACGGATIALGAYQTTTFNATCIPISVSPVANRWNVVGLAASAAVSLEMGSVVGTTQLPSDLPILVADGRQGMPTSTTGLLRGPGNTSTSMSVRFAPATQTFGVNGSFWSIGASPIAPIQVYEFTVAVPGTYRVAGLWQYFSGGSVRALVFAPRANGEWTDTTSAVGNGELLGTGWNSGVSMSLSPGVHLLVLYSPGTPIATYGSFDIGIGQVQNPLPILNSLTPGRLLAGSGAASLSLQGSGFVANSTVEWNGIPLATTVTGTTQITATVPSALTDQAGFIPIRVVNPTPGGGMSSSLSLDVAEPRINTLFPFVLPPLSQASPPSTIQIQGQDFAIGCQVFADGRLIPSVRQSAVLIHATVDASIPGTLIPGAVAITVRNFSATLSNSQALRFGAGVNQGTIIRVPLAPAPGDAYGVRLEGGVPMSPTTLCLSVGAPHVLTPWPSAVAPMVLSLNLGGIVPLFDGMGVFGAPDGFAFPGTGVPGRLDIPGFVAPNPALGIDLTVQGAYLDPSSPVGFRLNWARYPDSL